MATLEDQSRADEYGQDGRSVTNTPAFTRLARQSIGSTMYARFDPPLWRKALWFFGVPILVIAFFWAHALFAN